jgi:hypothetical protein
MATNDKATKYASAAQKHDFGVEEYYTEDHEFRVDEQTLQRPQTSPTKDGLA